MEFNPYSKIKNRYPLESIAVDIRPRNNTASFHIPTAMVMHNLKRNYKRDPRDSILPPSNYSTAQWDKIRYRVRIETVLAEVERETEDAVAVEAVVEGAAPMNNFHRPDCSCLLRTLLPCTRISFARSNTGTHRRLLAFTFGMFCSHRKKK